MLYRAASIRASARASVRRGAAMVETAAVAAIFLLFLFGVLEYCRLLYVQQVVSNAAREGARYAIVNASDSNLVAESQAKVLAYLGGLDKTLQNYSCQVYLSDVSGNNIGSAVDATFGQYICVEVSLKYSPIVPSFLFMNQNLTLSSKCWMGSEAN
jgi:Flp pilus assembly protein TadG